MGRGVAADRNPPRCKMGAEPHDGCLPAALGAGPVALTSTVKLSALFPATAVMLMFFSSVVVKKERAVSKYENPEISRGERAWEGAPRWDTEKVTTNTFRFSG